MENQYIILMRIKFDDIITGDNYYEFNMCWNCKN